MRILKQTLQLMVILMLFAGLAGCALLNPPKPDDPKFAPVAPERMRPPAENNGAIFQSGFSRNLFEDRRASRVGDIITIVLEETTRSSNDSSTNNFKNSDTQVSAPSVFGSVKALNTNESKILPNLNSAFNNQITADRTFNGSSKSNQNNRLIGTITVTVSDVLPNGNLMIRGEKWIHLNQGKDYIRLTGMVRPEDITSENTVASNKIADARIAYSGTGQNNDVNVMGWLARFFTTAFFPL